MALAVVFVAVVVRPACAQSLFDNGEGTGSLSLRAGSRLDFNFAEKLANLTLTTSKLDRITPKKVTAVPLATSDKPISSVRLSHLDRFSLSLRAKPDGNSANLFGSGRPGVGAGVTLGYGISYLASSLPSPLEDAVQGAVVSGIKKVEIVNAATGKKSEKWTITSLKKLDDDDQKARQKIVDAQTALTDANAALDKAKDGSASAFEEAKQNRLDAAAKLKEANDALLPYTDEPMKLTPFLKIRRDALRGLLQELKLHSDHTILHLDAALADPTLKNMNDLLNELNKEKGNQDLRDAIRDLTLGVDTLSPEQFAILSSPYGSHRPAADYDHLDFRIALDYDRFKLADVDANGDATMIGNHSTTSIDGLLAYNIQFGNQKSFDEKGNERRRTPLLLGLAAGFGRKNNRNDLDPIKTSGALPRSDFKESDAWQLNSDFAFSPGVLDNQVWLNLFTRNAFPRGKPEHRIGLGAFITEKGNTYKSVGGVAFSVASHESLRVDLVLGFNFGG